MWTGVTSASGDFVDRQGLTGAVMGVVMRGSFCQLAPRLPPPAAPPSQPSLQSRRCASTATASQTSAKFHSRDMDGSFFGRLYSLFRWYAMTPRLGRLKRRRRAKNIGFTVTSGDHLQTHRQASKGPTCGNRGGRLAGQVEGVGVVDPVDDVAAWQLGRRVQAHIKRGTWQGRREQQIEFLKKDPHFVAQLIA